MTFICKLLIIAIMKYNNVGKFIRRKRIEQGISLNECALNATVEGATLCRVETKPQDIKICWLAKIAAVFGMTLSEFMKEYENSQWAKEE